MTCRKSFLILISVILSMNVFSQNVNELGLEDLIPGGNSFSKYRVDMPKQLKWHGDKLLYVKGDSIVQFPNESKQEEKLFITKKVLNIGLSGNGKEELKNLTSIDFPYADSTILSISKKDEFILYNYADKKIVSSIAIAKDASNLDFSKESRLLAYTKDNNLYVISNGGQEQVVSSDDNKSIVSGQAVHRNEFGIAKGTFWSPKGNLLAFYKMDESMVTDYPLVDISARVAKDNSIKYPMTGMKSHQVRVGVYNPKTQETVFLKTGTPKDKYLTNVAWSPDEKSIYIAELNRGQDTCRLNRYNAQSGKLEATLFEETHPKYVEPEHPIQFLNNESGRFIWLSKRDGFNHVYLYDVQGNVLKQLTSGAWDVMSVLGFDEKNENLIYTSTQDSPIEEHIYKLNLKKGNITKLSKEAGVHAPLLSASGKYVCDVFSSQYVAGKVALTDVHANKTSMLYEAKNPYKDKKLPEIVLGSIKANDKQTDLYYRLVKPVDFDPNKKYPVVIYVYGGPHSQLVTNSWMGQVRGWDVFMAEKGYVVFTLDNRGTSNRGADFENITHRRLGIVETEDQMTGVDFLKSQSYVDADRIGVHGWSYGGYMTLNLMLRHPDVFKVGVAGGPVTDWKYYEIMYGERYMDSPQENPDGYAESSMLNKASQLKGRLLLIHGDEDPVVVMQHNLQFIKSSIKSGTHPDLFIYPGHGHNMVGRDRVHLHEHITRYFDDFLK